MAKIWLEKKRVGHLHQLIVECHPSIEDVYLHLQDICAHKNLIVTSCDSADFVTSPSEVEFFCKSIKIAGIPLSYCGAYPAINKSFVQKYIALPWSSVSSTLYFVENLSDRRGLSPGQSLDKLTSWLLREETDIYMDISSPDTCFATLSANIIDRLYNMFERVQ